MRKINLILLFILLPVSLVFSAGTSEANLSYFPTNVVNNQKVMIDLSSGKHAASSSFEFDFKNSIDTHLAIFRLRDTLFNKKTNGGSSGLSQSNTNYTNVTIESLDGWNFIHETNPTQTRPFTLDIFCVESKFKWNYSSIQNSNYSSANAVQVVSKNNTPTGNFPTSNINEKGSLSGNSYILQVPDTDFSNNFSNFRAWYVRDFDICIGLDDDYGSLEPGYYSTRLKVSATVTKYTSSSSSSTETISEEITIYGYIGIDNENIDADMTYSFSVTHGDDTYNMNLGHTSVEGRSQDSYYDVAKITFMNVYSGTSEYGTYKNGQTTSNHTQASAKSHYDIYISPTSIYNDGGSYQFRKLGSENQISSNKNTIGYDLYVKNTSGGYTKLSSATDGSKIEGTLSTDSGSISYSNGTYRFRPKFSSRQISSVGNKKQYVVTWEADLELYLKVSDSSRSDASDTSTIHNSGIYYSYLYVSLVVN